MINEAEIRVPERVKFSYASLRLFLLSTRFAVENSQSSHRRTRKEAYKPPRGKHTKYEKREDVSLHTHTRIHVYQMQARDRPRCRRKVKQIATNGINDGIRDTLHRTTDFPAGQKCHLGRG